MGPSCLSCLEAIVLTLEYASTQTLFSPGSYASDTDQDVAPISVAAEARLQDCLLFH